MTEKFIILFMAVALWAFYRQAMAFKSDADKDREELERWHIGWQEQRRWLAEFPDVVMALEHLSAEADGRGVARIADLRESMRTRRDKSIIQLTPAEIQSGHDRVRWAEGLIQQLPADHDGRNSWLLNYARAGIEYAEADPVQKHQPHTAGVTSTTTGPAA